MRFTEKQIRSLLNKSKYRNKKTFVGDIKFDSKKEADHYIKLSLLEKFGKISDLKRQVKFDLNEGGTHSVKYIADFVYTENGEMKVVDVKGYRTREYLKKRKLMLKVHGIKIIEI